MKLLMSLLLSSCVLMLAPSLRAAPADSPEHNTRSKIIIRADKDYFDFHRHDTTEKVEVITKDRIEKSNATNLNEVVDRMPGVDSQDYCVNCGAKRISINGLRGDHTSVLVDGIPLYSAVNSIYGFDAISMQSIEEIEVKRGTGSALINPEAIGGTLNLITLMPKETGTRVRLSQGTYRSQTAELLHSYVSEKYKVSVGGEFSRQQPWDVDNNQVAESPFRDRYSFFAKQTWNITERTQWSLRASNSHLEYIGGTMGRGRLFSPFPTQASETDFVDGDVRKPYVGALQQITDNIRVQRTEATSKLIHILTPHSSLEWNVGAANYKQDSFYIHGYDYLTKNGTLYTDLRWTHQLGMNQALMLGTSARLETLRSQSQVMYNLNNLPRDDFDYKAFAGFVQHEWFLPYGWELSSALRFEHLDNRWRELGDLKKDVIAPRWMLKWAPTEHLSQQMAYGYGYRMPLTSVESAHGAYDGFVVDIDRLEKSHSFLYSLSYNTPQFYVTPSFHYTKIMNMAYPVPSDEAHNEPLRFASDNDRHEIMVYDLLLGFKPTSWWLIETSYEIYDYPTNYKNRLPTAAIEDRWIVRSEAEWKNYSFVISGQWIGARNLSPYNTYANHYNVSQGLLGVSDPKFQRAPSFWQWDLSFGRKFEALEVWLGVQNLFDETQTRAGDSPAMWHLHGDHTHFDNRHAWGINRGREAYLKVSYAF